jgi:hypothetical protein
MRRIEGHVVDGQQRLTTLTLLLILLHRRQGKRPGFVRCIQVNDLPFAPHTEFKKADMEQRSALYHRLADQIWDPRNLLREASQ